MDEKDVSLRDYFEVILHRKWIAITVFSIFIFFTLFFLKKAKPLYQATSKIMIEQETSQGILMPTFYFPFYRPTNVQNHCEIITSRAFAEFLATHMSEQTKKYLKKRWKDSIDISLLVRSCVSASAMKETDLILINATSKDKKTAVLLANEAAKGYREYNLSQRRADISAIKTFVENQLNIVRKRLDEEERELKKFKKENKIITLSNEASELVQKQSQLAYMIHTTQSEYEEKRKKLSYIKGIIEKEKTQFSKKLENISSPLLSNLKSNLSRLELERINLILQGYKERDPKIQALSREIEEVKAKIKNEAEKIFRGEGVIDPMNRLQTLFENSFLLTIEIEGLRKRLEVLKGIEKKYQAELSKLPEIERVLAKLERDVDVDRKIYSLLSQKHEEARIEEAGRLSLVRIISLADGAYQISPKTKRSIILGLILGLMFATGSCFLAEYLDRTVKDISKISEKTNIPVLGVVPSLGEKRFWPFLGNSIQFKNPGIYVVKPKTQGAEAFRLIRTNMKFSSPDKPLKTILVTSARGDEGKTTVAVNLGIVFSEGKQKTIVVDADLRKPHIHKFLKISKVPGFTDVIVGNIGLTDAVHKVNDYLCFLPSGTIPPNSSDFLDSESFTLFLKRLSKKFDVVIIDSAPILGMADTLILTPKVNAGLIIVRIGKTDRDSLQHASKLLKDIAKEDTKLYYIANDISFSSKYGYYSYYSYYYYSYPRKEK